MHQTEPIVKNKTVTCCATCFLEVSGAEELFRCCNPVQVLQPLLNTMTCDWSCRVESYESRNIMKCHEYTVIICSMSWNILISLGPMPSGPYCDRTWLVQDLKSPKSPAWSGLEVFKVCRNCWTLIILVCHKIPIAHLGWKELKDTKRKDTKLCNKLCRYADSSYGRLQGDASLLLPCFASAGSVTPRKTGRQPPTCEIEAWHLIWCYKKHDIAKTRSQSNANFLMI